MRRACCVRGLSERGIYTRQRDCCRRDVTCMLYRCVCLVRCQTSQFTCCSNSDGLVGASVWRELHPRSLSKTLFCYDRDCTKSAAHSWVVACREDGRTGGQLHVACGIDITRCLCANPLQAPPLFSGPRSTRRELLREDIDKLIRRTRQL